MREGTLAIGGNSSTTLKLYLAVDVSSLTVELSASTSWDAFMMTKFLFLRISLSARSFSKLPAVSKLKVY